MSTRRAPGWPVSLGMPRDCPAAPWRGSGTPGLHTRRLSSAGSGRAVSVGGRRLSGQTTHPGVFELLRCHTGTVRWAGRVGGVGGFRT